MSAFAVRATILATALVGIIAYDAYRYRRQLARFARFVTAYELPSVAEPEQVTSAD